jgi:hypothetical protein
MWEVVVARPSEGTLSKRVEWYEMMVIGCVKV